jgi:hypothetical protein
MLHSISAWALILSAVSFLAVAVDVVSHRQKMMVMNFVWPVTALYFGPFALLTYFGFGRDKMTDPVVTSEGKNQKYPSLASTAMVLCSCHGPKG